MKTNLIQNFLETHERLSNQNPVLYYSGDFYFKKPSYYIETNVDIVNQTAFIDFQNIDENLECVCDYYLRLNFNFEIKKYRFVNDRETGDWFDFDVDINIKGLQLFSNDDCRLIEETQDEELLVKAKFIFHPFVVNLNDWIFDECYSEYGINEI